MKTRNVRGKVGRWARVGFLAIGALGCKASDLKVDTKGGPGERSAFLVARTAGPTRTGVDLTLLGLDVVKDSSSSKVALVPSVVAWTPTGWKGTGLNFIASTDVNNEGSNFLAAGIAKSFWDGTFTGGIRGLATPAGNSLLLAGKLNLPRNTQFFYSANPEDVSGTQQVALRNTFEWRGPLVSVIARGDGKDLNPTLGAEVAWGRNALGFARHLQEEVNEVRYVRGLGDGASQLSLFRTEGPNGWQVGLGWQISLGSSRKPRRTGNSKSGLRKKKEQKTNRRFNPRAIRRR